MNSGRYLYYRCPCGSSGPGTTTCGSRYVRTERLEAAVKAALADVLASPERLLDEARRLASQEVPVDSRLDSVLTELNEVEARQRRLVQLFTRGDLPEDMLSAESKVLAERRGVLEAQRRSLDVPRPAQSIDPARIARDLPRALRLIRAWVEEADGADFDLVLRALNAQIVASSEAIEVRGEVPLIAEAPQSFATIERTSGCQFIAHKRRNIASCWVSTRDCVRLGSPVAVLASNRGHWTRPQVAKGPLWGLYAADGPS